MGEVYLAEDTRLGRRGGAEVPAAGRAAGRGEPRAADARGARRVRPALAEHRRHLRRRRVRRRAVHRDGVRGRREPRRRAWRAGRCPCAMRSTSSPSSPTPSTRRTRTTSFTATSRAPTSFRRARGLVKVLDFGLAKMESALERRGAPGDVAAARDLAGHRRRHRVVHGARAVDGRRDGSPRRSVLSRRRPVRDAGGTPAVHRRTAWPRCPTASSITTRRRSARFNYSVPPELDAIVRKALEKNPSFRYQSARELHIDLHRLARRLEGTDSGTSSMFVRHPDPLPPAAVSAHTASGERSIAVLTFANVTREAADDWIGTGIAETVTADLKNVQPITVIGRAQIFELLKNMPAADAGDDRLAIDIGRRLGAWWVVCRRLPAARRADPHHRAPARSAHGLARPHREDRRSHRRHLRAPGPRRLRAEPQPRREARARTRPTPSSATRLDPSRHSRRTRAAC